MTTTNNTITNVTITRKSGNGGAFYGQYQVSGYVNGVLVKAYTTNSEAFDWLNDDSNEEKHIKAIDYCFSLIKRTYENL
jgi:hypothetical protein